MNAQKYALFATEGQPNAFVRQFIRPQAKVF